MSLFEQFSCASPPQCAHKTHSDFNFTITVTFVSHNFYNLTDFYFSLTLPRFCCAVPFRELPRYNPRRRSVLSPLPLPAPPSPSPSRCSLPPFSSASSSLSETSSGSNKTTTTEDTGSYVTGRFHATTKWLRQMD